MRKRRGLLILITFILTISLTPIGFLYFKLYEHQNQENENFPPAVKYRKNSENLKDSEECGDFSKIEEFSDFWPKCLERFREVKETWKSNSCLSTKINNSTCSIRKYLSEVENACPPNPKDPQDIAHINTNLEVLLNKFGNDKSYDFMKSRVINLWPEWVNSTKNRIFNEEKHRKRRKLRIFVFFGFLANEKTVKMADGSGKGGPLGEMVQWADLLAAMVILGHDVFLANDKRSLMSQISSLGLHHACSTSPPATLLKTHLIFTDIMGRNKMSAKFRQDNACRFRILDSFGTHAEFAVRRDFNANYGKYQGPRIKKRNPWGGLDLDLGQHWTYYPHTHDNTFLGFVVRGPKALVYGKAQMMWKGAEGPISILQQYFEVHATVADLEDAPIFKNIRNHGLLGAQGIQKLYEQVDVFFGLGFPLEGPAPLEAIANGAIFVNPRFADAKNRKNWEFLGDKPTLRRFSSQNPYAEQFIGEPHVITVDIYNETELRVGLEKALGLGLGLGSRQEGFVPYEFTAQGFLERLAILLENQDFCVGQVGRRKFPPAESLRIARAESGQNCEEACRMNGWFCERSMFGLVNREEVLRK
ncbi:unnamed protein product [Caenorhabditis angaria]|uniref:alpha-1,6-mannosyl-glycoprotein 6-beta-N-acetylglucosaminyltransferase n=1 Tax=Caenorhabditis angaria TaxID=860376 RepID=A0A9P1I8K0_9PELO|nr:unnamed protein product [Caenorhabditis angaria]